MDVQLEYSLQEKKEPLELVVAQFGVDYNCFIHLCRGKKCNIGHPLGWVNDGTGGKTNVDQMCATCYIMSK